MSRTGEIFDAFYTILGTTLPTHNELVNPYFPEIDSELAYSAAYGVTLNEGSNLLGNENSGTEQRSRVFEIILFRRKFATKGNIAARKSTEKELMDDWTAVVNAIASDRTLGGLPLQRVFYTNDNGIEFLRTEDNRNDILLIRIFFQVDFDESVPLCT